MILTFFDGKVSCELYVIFEVEVSVVARRVFKIIETIGSVYIKLTI